MDDMSIEQWEAKVAAEPLVPEHVIMLIDLLRKATPRNEDKTKTYRELFVSSHLTNKAFWQQWLSDTMESRDVEACVSLFNEALASVPDFEIALAYVEFCTALVDAEKMTTEAMRSLFERLIVTCGTDVFTGSEVWRRYREFEVDEHEELLDMQAPAADIQKSKERFIKVYVRQLSLPLVGNEDTLKDFEEKLGEFCVESDASLFQPTELEKKITTSRELREGRLIYEMHLLSDKYTTSSAAEQEQFWQGYITFEKKAGQLSRVQRLYERAVLECPQSITLWLEFTDFALTTLKNWQLISSVTKRAVKVHRNSLFLWKLRLLSMECSNEAPELVQATVQHALAAGLPGVEEYLEIYLAYCDYKRRLLQTLYNKYQAPGSKLSTSESAEKLSAQIELLQTALQQAQVFLSAYGAQWPAGWWKLCKYQSQVEVSLLAPAQAFLVTLAAADAAEVGPAIAFTAKTAAKKIKAVKTLPGSDIWETATKIFPGTFFLWSEYILWARNVGEYEHCRKLYRKLTNLHLDVDTEEVCKEWVLFEQQYGTLADLQAALIRAYPHAQSAILRSVAADTAAQAAQQQHHQQSHAMQVAEPAHSRADSSHRQAAAQSTTASDSKRKRSNSQTQEEAELKDAQGSAKKGKFSTETSHATYVSEPIVVPLSYTTVVVSNFPFAASLDTVRPLLEDKCRLSGTELSEAGISPEQCKVVDMRLVLSKAGHSRGMVEIEFAPFVCMTESEEQTTAQRVMLQMVVQALNGSTYNDRALRAEIKPLPPPVSAETTMAAGKFRPEKVDPLVAQQRAGSLAAPHLTTVFVSHLPASVDNAELSKHFESCGAILAAKVAVDKKTGESKCTGLVQFKDEAGRSSALKLNKTQLGSAMIGVTPSRFSLIPVAATASTSTASANTTSSAPRSAMESVSRVDRVTAGAEARTAHGSDGAGSGAGPSAGVGASSGTDSGKGKAQTALAKVSTMSFKPRNLVKQTPKGKIQL